MNILVDFTQIPINKVGVGVYAVQTFSRIIEQDVDNRYFFVVQDDDDELCDFKAVNLKVIKIKSKIFRNFICRGVLEQLYLPYLKLRFKINIIHSLHYSFPLFSLGAKRVVTLHDMTFFLYPKLHVRIKRMYFRFFISLSTKLSSRIIAVSESTANDVFSYFPNIVKNKVVSIPLACQIPLYIAPSSIPSPYISFIGTLEPRKNIDSLINAFSKLIEHSQFSEYKLVIVGKKGWYFDSIFELIECLGLENKIILTGFVSDNEKFSILKSSNLFVYPSYYEGFGLPVLEALSVGVPTITSNISSLPEVAGPDSVLVDPNSVEQIYLAMERVLSDIDLQQTMKAKGLKYAHKFSWNNTSNRTIQLYNTLANK